MEVHITFLILVLVLVLVLMLVLVLLSEKMEKLFFFIFEHTNGQRWSSAEGDNGAVNLATCHFSSLFWFFDFIHFHMSFFYLHYPLSLT